MFEIQDMYQDVRCISRYKASRRMWASKSMNLLPAFEMRVAGGRKQHTISSNVSRVLTVM
jgi:hypothetical protein